MGGRSRESLDGKAQNYWHNRTPCQVRAKVATAANHVNAGVRQKILFANFLPTNGCFHLDKADNLPTFPAGYIQDAYRRDPRDRSGFLLLSCFKRLALKLSHRPV